jgi:hypothetical protein
MIRTPLAATMLLLAVTPAFAQSQQQALDARYDRALAAGYKALMLCSAIAISERNGTSRRPESVEAMELTGIQTPHNALLAELPYQIVRRPTGQIAHVAVKWADDMPARIAAYFGPDTGCSTFPIGASEDSSTPAMPVPVAPQEQDKAGRRDTIPPLPVLAKVLDSALAGQYGQGTRTTAALVRIKTPGKGIVEQAAYAPGYDEKTPQRTWSVAKSIAATLVGAAVLSDGADVNEPVGINYWRAGGASDPRNAITLDHALRMATGRYSDTPGNRTDPLYFGGSTVDETAINLPLIHKPGTVFRYANSDTLLALKAIGGWLTYYPPHEFFARLGMTHTVAETDIRGEYILSSQVCGARRAIWPSSASSISMTACSPRASECCPKAGAIMSRARPDRSPRAHSAMGRGSG